LDNLLEIFFQREIILIEKEKKKKKKKRDIGFPIKIPMFKRRD